MDISHECIRCGKEFKTADALINHVEAAHPAPTLDQFLSRVASDCVNGR